MNVKKWVAGVVMLLLAGSSCLALYYRNETVCLLQEKNETLDRLKRDMAAKEVPVRVSTAAESKPVQRTTVAPATVPSAGAAAEQVVGTIQQTADPGQSSTGVADRTRRGGTAWLENMRTNDPARYETFQQRRKEMEDKAQNAWLNTMDYFSSRDTSNMGEQDIDEYNWMMTVLDQTRVLTAQLQIELPREQRRQVMHAVWSNVVVLTPMLENERNRELYDMAHAMGQDSSDAASFVSYVNQISSNTSLHTIFPDTLHGGFVPRGRGPGNPPSEPAPQGR